jgi:hypothetical protein
MNSTFNLNRFWKLIKIETLINKGIIVKLLLGLLVVSLLAHYLALRTIEDSDIVGNIVETLYLSIFKNIVLVFTFLVPIFLYYNLYHKVKNVGFAILPASQLEKVISAIVQTTIIAPALLMAVMTLFLLVIRWTVFPNLEFKLTPIAEDLFEIIQFQSFLLLGVFWFKNNKLLKIILTVIVISILFAMLVYFITTVINPPPEWFKDFVYGISEFLYNNSIFRTVIKFLVEYKKVILAIIFPLLPYTVAFLKYRRTQI